MGSPLEDRQVNFYEDADILNVYTFMQGICVLPIAEQPPTDLTALAAWSPVVTLQLHAPYRIRKYSSGTKKQNNPPVVAAPDNSGAFVFVGGSIGFSCGFNQTMYNSDWNVDTEYVFIENCVSRPQDGFILGKLPASITVDTDNLVTVTPGSPTIGAVAQASQVAKVGWQQGISILVTPSQNPLPNDPGLLKDGWTYNTQAFFPGQLLNGTMVNGGTA